MSNTETNFTDVSTDIIRHAGFVKQLDSIKELLSLSAQLGAHILGLEAPKDVGITTMLNDFCGGYPRKVEEIKTIVPILFVTTPTPIDIPMMGREMLRCLGDHQADDYQDIGIINRKLIQYVGTDCDTMLVILDDFHHLLEPGTMDMYFSVGNWIKYLAESTKTPFVLTGREGTLSKMLKTNPELMGIFDVEKFEPFAWDPHRRETIQEFGDFLGKMEEIVGLDLPWRHDTDVDLLYRMYYATDGTAGAVKRLMTIAANKAREKGADRIEMEILRHVFQGQNRKGLKAHNPFDKNWGDRFSPPRNA